MLYSLTNVVFLREMNYRKVVALSIENEAFMTEALCEAQAAFALGEVPVGAIVVDSQGKIIGRGYNRVESLGCQVHHAEVIAIAQAAKHRKDWRLDDCCLYVTLEPCLMCFGLIGLSRIKALFFGARSPLFGSGLDNKDAFPLYKKDLAVQGGLKQDECIMLLAQFFKEKRSIKKGKV